MEQTITLQEYLHLGGNLEKVDWTKSFCDYSDFNRGAKVVSFENKSEFGGHGTPLFHFTFDNGRTHRYAITWIRLKVEFVLSEVYK